MISENELQDLRLLLAKAEKRQKKSRIRLAIVLATAAFIILVFFVYAFVQQTAAKKAALVALDFRQELQECEKRAVEAEKAAEMQRIIAVEAMAQAERSLAEAVRQEKIAKKSKK